MNELCKARKYESRYGTLDPLVQIQNHLMDSVHLPRQMAVCAENHFHILYSYTERFNKDIHI